MWIQLAIAVISMVVSAAINASMKPKTEPLKADKLDIPQIDESKPISVIFGTVLKKDAQVVWYGDPGTNAIRTKGGKK
jgi:hypothetical protein